MKAGDGEKEEKKKRKGRKEKDERGCYSWKCCVRFPLSSPRTVKRLTEGCNEAQGSGVNMFDTLTLTQPAVETSRCPHTLALISHTHTHTLVKKHTPAYSGPEEGRETGGR